MNTQEHGIKEVKMTITAITTKRYPNAWHWQIRYSNGDGITGATIHDSAEEAIAAACKAYAGGN